MVFVAGGYAQPPVLTWHNDNARTGQNQNETILTPANVNSSTFGKLATLSVDGKVDAQPLYVPSVTIPSKGVRNVLYVATEHDSVYAFDADTFEQLLKVSLLVGAETTSDPRSCTQVYPEIGITATPVIDLSKGPHGTIYLIAMSQGADGYHQRLHALDLTTLGEQFSGPVEIQGVFPGSGAENTFVAAVHKERAALLLVNGVIYTSWSSHCDLPPYASWILSYNASTLAPVGVMNLTPNGNDGGIWAAGSGPASDASGNVYVISGNGTFDTTLDSGGFPAQRDFGNAFTKLSTAGPLAVTDYFTMSGTVQESAQDVDLGSGGLMLLPPLNNTHGVPVSLVVGAGKDGAIYVLDSANMGKFNPSMDSIYQFLPEALHGGTWSSPAWFNGVLYYNYPDHPLTAFTFANGQFAQSATSSTVYKYPGTTPTISSNGTSNGIVWTVEKQSVAILHAYDATNIGVELYNSSQAPLNRDQLGTGVEWPVPTITNGKVYVGMASGVGVFGRLSGPATPSLSITKTHTGNFTQAQQGTYTLTISNAAGSASTSGVVTVTENPPSGLSVLSLAGGGWTCSGNTCNRSDALAASSSYPPITATVSVASNAPSSLTNSVSVSGGGDPGVKIASDPTVITPQTFTLTTSVSPSGGGSVTPASGSTFANGTVVNLQATAAPGFSFVNWTGSVASPTSASTTVTMNSNQTVTANFTAQTFTLTTGVSPVGAGTVTPASGSTFGSGTVVNLQATPAAGYSFANWTGSVASPTSPSTTVTMNSSQTVTANFTAGATTLGGANTAKSGPANARQWVFMITNNGPGAAHNPAITAFTLTQAGGAACTPVVLTPSSFPFSLGDLAPGASEQATVTVDFSSCASGARFTLLVNLSANGGAAAGSILRYNQFQ
jgi:Divergent InlB B-repeat domain